MIELYSVAGLARGRLAVALRPRGADWLEDELRDLRRRGWTTLVTTLEAVELREFELEALATTSRQLGVEWVHYPIPDRTVPALNPTLLLARSLHERVRTGGSVAVHCRQGIGRSSTVVAATLVVGGSTANAAWAIVEAARGRTVPDTPDQRTWLTELERAVRTPHGSSDDHHDRSPDA